MRALLLQLCLGFAYGNEILFWMFLINISIFTIKRTRFKKSHLKARPNLSTLPCIVEVVELLAALMLHGVGFFLEKDVANEPHIAQGSSPTKSCWPEASEEASCVVDPLLPLMWLSLLATVATGEKTTRFSWNKIFNRMSASQLGVEVGSHELYSEDPDQEAFAVREVRKFQNY